MSWKGMRDSRPDASSKKAGKTDCTTSAGNTGNKAGESETFGSHRPGAKVNWKGVKDSLPSSH